MRQNYLDILYFKNKYIKEDSMKFKKKCQKEYCNIRVQIEFITNWVIYISIKRQICSYCLEATCFLILKMPVLKTI